jgi:hypothetical protein
MRTTFTTGECQLCDDIWQLLIDPENAKDRIVFGSLQHALAVACPKHTPILQAFETHARSSSLSNVGFIHPHGLHLSVTGDPVSLFDLGNPFVSQLEMLLVNKESTANHPGAARILDAEEVSIELLKYWISQCCGSHASCTTTMNTAPTVPALLVDVRRKRIVTGISGHRYAALSYRFGEAAHFELDGDLLHSLRQDFALSKSEILERLPLTVRHAISLVEALGHEYLWTDSLCITHEDEDFIHDDEDPGILAGQLEQMAAIYSSALFTIVAMDGDGTTGLAGLSGISAPRTLDQKIIQFGAEHLVIRKKRKFHRPYITAYHGRAWTYQEFLMSARKLIFYKDEAHWMCQCCEWHEDLARDVEINKYIDSRPQLLAAGVPDLNSLGQLLGDYNQRNLTYNEDALAAVSGLLAVLSRTFIGGFLYGLPEMMFDTALGWNFHDYAERFKREPSQARHRDQCIPTWSWLSWRGQFEWGSNGEAKVRDGLRRPRPQETSPITEWYTSGAPEGRPRRKICPTWYEERERAKDARQPLADDWTRHEATAGLTHPTQRLFPDGCGSHVYEHRNTQVREAIQYWYYPFRVASIEPSTPFFNPPQMRYLFCKTCKTTVLACGSQRLNTVKTSVEVNLQKDIGRPVIGTMRMNNWERFGQRFVPKKYRWSMAVDPNRNPETLGTCPIEVVAINRVVESSNRVKEAVGQGDPLITRNEYVTVLWVEWEGGVAYRQACGRIEREAWENLELEEIDLVLG